MLVEKGPRVQRDEQGRSAAIYRWNPGVASRSLGGTAFVLLNGCMVSLNAVGTHIWELCQSGSNPAQLAAAITERFDATADVAARDVMQFLAILVSKELLVIDGQAATKDSTGDEQ